MTKYVRRRKEKKNPPDHGMHCIYVSIYQFHRWSHPIVLKHDATSCSRRTRRRSIQHIQHNYILFIGPSDLLPLSSGLEITRGCWSVPCQIGNLRNCQLRSKEVWAHHGFHRRKQARSTAIFYNPERCGYYNTDDEDQVLWTNKHFYDSTYKRNKVKWDRISKCQQMTYRMGTKIQNERKESPNMQHDRNEC